MGFFEKDVPNKYTAFINLFVLVIFIPFLLYAVYQSITLFSRASGKPANIVVDANYPLPIVTGRPQTQEKSTAGSTTNMSIFTMINGVAGSRLNVTGESTWVNAIASKQKSKYMVLIYNLDNEGKNTETVPVTVKGIMTGTYNSRLTYLKQSGCAVNDPPLHKPPREIMSNDQLISTLICITPQNAVLWELEKIR